MNHFFLNLLAALRKFVRRADTWRLKIQYKTITNGVTVDDKLIVFESYMGRQYSCNPRALYEYMLSDERFDNYKFVWAFKDIRRAASFPLLKHARIIKYGSSEYLRAVAAAKIYITNSNAPSGIIRKPNQIFLQTWHGTPLKRLRCDIEAEYGNARNSLQEIRMKNDMDIVRYDYLLSSCPFTTDKFTSAFNLKQLDKEDMIIETGYPRNDILFRYDSTDQRKLRNDLNLPSNKKIILYAPTFRDNQHKAGKGYVYDVKINFDKLREALGDEYVILFRAHYFVANAFDFQKYEGFVYDVSGIDDIKELYIISDILITDYSSVFFDYANLKRPILFYMYDLDEYSNDIRGFYLSLDELPGKIVKTEEALIDAICTESFVYDEKYQRFNRTYNCLEDGDASKRVVDRILT